MALKVWPSIFILIAAVTVCLCQIDNPRRRPNIIFILTDDQDIVLGGMTPMNKTRDHFTKNGMFFENGFTHVPICCPSRASILTGRYLHNTHVINNTWEGNCDGDQWRHHSEQHTYAKYLHDAGYRTFYAGKYLNTYGLDGDYRVPPGWDNWHGLVGNSVYYNYTLSEDGDPVDYGLEPEDYLTDVIHDKGIKFINSISTKTEKPFLMVLSTPTCHYPYTPSVKYEGNFTDLKAPRTPNFEKPSQTKRWLLRQAHDNFSEFAIDFLDTAYGKRWAALLSVDDMVADVVSTLQKKGFLDNTYIFYFSDHGYHFGQFGLPIEKYQMYEFDIRVPFMVSGPGIKPGSIRKEPVVSVDLTPTFLDLAGANVGQRSMDGKSLVPLLKSETEEVASDWRTSFLVEYRGQGNTDPHYFCPQFTNQGLSLCFPDCICEDAFNNTYDCLRVLDASKKQNMLYCSCYDSEDYVEAYDMDSDPYQMDNLAVSFSQSFKDFIRLLLKTLTGGPDGN